MAKLVVRLLGGFHVELDREAVYDFETDKARALLAYLLVEADRPHRRETLACLLWPNMPDTVARTNLRLALSRVRRALRDRDANRPPFLFVTSSDIQFNTASDYTLDVAELEAFARLDLQHAPPDLLPEALSADFLAGFAAPDSEAFEAWVLNKQERYHRLALEILDGQAAYFEGMGEYAQAAAAARLQLQLEPWLEEAHQRRMRDLARAGRREEALQQYETCRRVLQRELGLEPTAGTQTLYDEIRSGKLGSRNKSRPVRFLKPHRSDPYDRSGSPLVARGDQLGQLRSQLERALGGETGVVFVRGDAGSGKTMLLEAFAERAMAQHPDLLVAGARCNPGGSLDACAPLRRLAEVLFGDLANHTAWRLHGSEQVARLQVATSAALEALAEHGPDLVGTLISAASIARRGVRFATKVTHAPMSTSPPSPLSQGVLFDQLLAALAALAEEQPLLLLLDDLHWVDDATTALLLRLGRELGDSPILLAGAYRSTAVALGRRDPRSGGVNRHPLAEVINELRRVKGEVLVDLDRADGRAFVEAYVDTEPNRLGAAFRDALYAQTAGHALFTVELLRNLQARGEIYKDEAGRWVAAESLDWGALPARVEAAIAERIDHLPENERRILSAASVQGDDFVGEIAAELAGLPAAGVLACLSESLARQHHLVKPEGLARAPAGEQARSLYRFTHHLFQRYIYDQLDPVERAQMHGQVAGCLDRQAAGSQAERERHAARLAWHYEAAGLPLRAARTLLDAGNQAMRVAAFREALARYDHGLALLATAAPSLERRQVAGLLEVARLGPERNLEGLASAGVADALARATTAWAASGGEAPAGESPLDGSEERPRLMLLLAETESLTAAGEFERALLAAERLAERAVRSGAEEFAGAAQVYFGAIHQGLGNPRESEEHLRGMLDRLTPERRAELRAATGLDLLVIGLSFSALNAWFQGRFDRALARSRQAIAAARADGAPVGEAAATAIGAGLQFLLRGPEASAEAGGTSLVAGEMAEYAQRCCELCRKQGLQMWGVFGEVMLGRVRVLHGEALAGIERIRGLGWRRAPIKLLTDFFTVVLADSCLLAAERDSAERRLLATGLVAIDDKLGPARIPSNQAYEAELHRLKGELLLARDGQAAAEDALACFRNAIELGRAKDVLALELRATMSLVRLRARACTERRSEASARELAEARACLAGIYARFTEGFDSPDLQEAAALIGPVEETPRKP